MKSAINFSVSTENVYTFNEMLEKIGKSEDWGPVTPTYSYIWESWIDEIQEKVNANKKALIPIIKENWSKELQFRKKNWWSISGSQYTNNIHCLAMNVKLGNISAAKAENFLVRMKHAARNNDDAMSHRFQEWDEKIFENFQKFLKSNEPIKVV